MVREFVCALTPGADDLARARIVAALMTAAHAKWPLALGAAMEVVAVCGSAKAVNIIAAVVMIPVTNTKLSRKYGDPP